MVGTVKLAIVVPVLTQFQMFTEMMATVDVEHRLYVIESYRENNGVSWAWNTGMDRALADGYEYALICNDDIWFEPGAIGKMYNTIIKTGAVLVSPNQNGNLPQDGVVPGADFFCFMVDIKQLLEKCGRFDHNFWPAYFEDNDMHWRINLAGATALMNRDAIVYHHGSATQNAIPAFPVTPPEQFLNNMRYYVEKWGGEPGKECFEHPYNNPALSIKDFR